MRPAVEIARALPSLAGLDDDRIASVISDDCYEGVGWVCPSRGEVAVLDFAEAAERMLDACDAETIDAALERLDRVREAMRPPTPSVRDLMDNLEASLAAAKAKRP